MKNKNFQLDESWQQVALRASLFLQEEARAAQQAQQKPKVLLQRIVIFESDDETALVSGSSSIKVHMQTFIQLY
jgi:hypothetical protein